MHIIYRIYIYGYIYIYIPRQIWIFPIRYYYFFRFNIILLYRIYSNTIRNPEDVTINSSCVPFFLIFILYIYIYIYDTTHGMFITPEKDVGYTPPTLRARTRITIRLLAHHFADPASAERYPGFSYLLLQFLN